MEYLSNSSDYSSVSVNLNGALFKHIQIDEYKRKRFLKFESENPQSHPVKLLVTGDFFLREINYYNIVVYFNILCWTKDGI